MGLINNLREFFRGRSSSPDPSLLPAETDNSLTSETGSRQTDEQRQRTLYWSGPQVDYSRRTVVLDIRYMDATDGRIKRIHNRTARDVVRGGLVMQQTNADSRISQEWRTFSQRLQLNVPAKLKSDARALLMEGNLALQWVLDADGNVIAAVRMPSETIQPNVNENGQLKDIQRAYRQEDVLSGQALAEFALWQLAVGRLDPDNYDDMGSMGRPFLDASRETWRKLRMTDTDLVLRRRQRAPLRLSHVLEGATDADLAAYQERTEANNDQITTDFYLNKKGTVTALQGDANLDQIGDVLYLLDTLFAGSPLPKGMAGYTDALNRDILEDLKRDYYEEIDLLQDTQSAVYEFGFRLHLLLRGINPDAEEWSITFSERRTESLTQTTDRALKLMALGLPRSMIWEEIGKNAAAVEARRQADAKNYDPYPEEPSERIQTVKITPGNGRKGDSATSVSNG